MSTIVAEEPCIIHTLPGRLRIHLPGWHGQGKRDLETKIRQLAGVHSVQASPVTSNILLYFDPEVIDKETLLATVKDLYDKSVGPGQDIAPLRSAPLARSVLREKRGPTTRLHIPIRGLGRDPQLAGSIKKTLEHLHPGVHVHINMLTGHVVVDFTEHEVKIDDILSTIVGMDLPEVSDEKLPTNPLNPIPLINRPSIPLGPRWAWESWLCVASWGFLNHSPVPRSLFRFPVFLAFSRAFHRYAPCCGGSWERLSAMLFLARPG